MDVTSHVHCRTTHKNRQSQANDWAPSFFQDCKILSIEIFVDVVRRRERPKAHYFSFFQIQHHYIINQFILKSSFLNEIIIAAKEISSKRSSICIWCIANKQELQQHEKFHCIKHLLLVVYLASWFNWPYSSSFLFITGETEKCTIRNASILFKSAACFCCSAATWVATIAAFLSKTRSRTISSSV
jgi:hypothetical protein